MKLHLFNGDSTLHQFRKTKLTGDTIVWREILCEGKTVADLSSEQFWSTRQQFLQQFVTDFDVQMHKELKNAFQQIDLPKYEEIILWFEYDLFCQINLLGVLSWLSNKTRDSEIIIMLICVGKHPNYPKLVALGNLNTPEFAALYPNRQVLNTADLIFAARIWAIYCSADHTLLLKEIQADTSTAFPYLEAAMYQHQKRFPNIENGLTDIESRMLHLLAHTPRSKQELVRELLNTQEVYGFGDLQYFKILEDLKPLLKEEDERLFINQLGKKVLANQVDFKEWRTNFYNYGGTNIGGFRWNVRKDTISHV